MKIAFLLGIFPSVSETFVLNQITGLIDQGHTVDIYASRPENLDKVHPDVVQYKLDQRTFYYETISPNYGLRALKSLYLCAVWGMRYPRTLLQAFNVWRYGNYVKSMRLLHEIVPFLRNGCPEYDVIHCHFGPNGIKGMHLRDLGVIQGQLSTVFHGLDVSSHLVQAGKDVYSQLFQTGDLFLPISERWKNRLLELGAPAEKTKVHHMGIDCRQFAFRPRSRDRSDSVQLVTVCRLVEKKGVEYAIRAVAALQQYFPQYLPPIHYTIVGDGSLKSELESLIAELRAEATIKILGWRQKAEVIEILESAHLFLAPSVTAQDGDQEGIPVALMEAMAMGLPIVSTDHSGIPELIESRVSGWLVPERDVNALAGALFELIQHPELAQPMSLTARRKVEAEFNIHMLNGELADHFQRLIEDSLCRTAYVS